MTRRSVFAFLAAAIAAVASFRPLSALKRRPPARGPSFRGSINCYRGFINWKPGGTGQTVVWRPDFETRLEPLPVKFVEEQLIQLRWKPWKYGTPRPEPGFSWGTGPGPGQGTGQLASALLLDHTGDRELTALEARWFSDVLEGIGTLSWEMSPAWIDEWLAAQQRRRESGRLRCYADGRHSLPIW